MRVSVCAHEVEAEPHSGAIMTQLCKRSYGWILAAKTGHSLMPCYCLDNPALFLRIILSPYCVSVEAKKVALTPDLVCGSIVVDSSSANISLHVDMMLVTLLRADMALSRISQ